MIGTAIDGFIFLGGGGAGGDFKTVNIAVNADAATLQHNDLTGATQVLAIISRANGIINQNIVFNPATGRITLPVYQGETYTIIYK